MSKSTKKVQQDSTSDDDRRYPRTPALRPTEDQMQAMRGRIAQMGTDDVVSACNLVGYNEWIGHGSPGPVRRQHHRNAGRCVINLVRKGTLAGLVIITGTRSPVLYKKVMPED